MTEDPLAVTLPMAAASDSVADVLVQMDGAGAAAIVVADNGDYSVQLIEKIRDAEASSPIRAVGGEPLGRLTTKSAAKLGLDLTGLLHGSVSKAFGNLSYSAMVVAVARGAHGGDIAVVLRRSPSGDQEKGLFAFLGDVYICDVDSRRYSAPGNCPDHPKRKLRKISP